MESSVRPPGSRNSQSNPKKTSFTKDLEPRYAIEHDHRSQVTDSGNKRGRARFGTVKTTRFNPKGESLPVGLIRTATNTIPCAA